MAGDPAEPSDEELMAEVAAGNRAAFNVLSRRHLKRSLGLAMRIAGNAQDAEEVVQDAFLQVWRHADRWRGDQARFTTWLYRIVVNRALTYRRRRGFDPLEAAAEIPSALPDAQATVEERQLAKWVDGAIAALPERQRAALSLCVYEELTCAEAAKVLDVSVSAMESLLVRARRVLRETLRPLIGPADTGPDRGPNKGFDEGKP
ncbi:RNA polymerase sigma factor [Azospirillum canadense]|uniref:RNA polymerase sigma factor n=1 Tax=Azospirillum canadense TaxID=403962 RepID=UPI0022261B5F|nr:RNA polymerase sigma factor [Azospirillum canadense]MCW2235743.1 RNA polymerase sigma-70 factor (ECF subfamily) [Azospirillum canadense]